MQLENIPDQSGIGYLRELSTHHLNASIKQLAGDSRIKKTGVNLIEARLEDFLIKLIIDGNDLGIKAVSNHFSFEAIFSLPNIRTLISSNVFSEDRAIAALIRIQDLLAKEFEVTPSLKIESIAWDIYDQYSHFTLVDFIKFLVMCKDIHFKTKFQHITTRGINREFIQEWLQEYEELRQGALKSIKDQFDDQSIFTPKLAKELVPRIGKNRKLFSESNNLKIKLGQLKKEFEEEEAKKSNSAKFINAIAYDFLVYDPLYKNVSMQKLWGIAKERAIKITDGWKQKYQSDPPVESEKTNELGEKEITADIFINVEDIDGIASVQRKSPPTQKEYCERHINIFLIKNEKRISSENPWSIIYEALLNEIIENDYALNDALKKWFLSIDLNESNAEKAGHKWSYLLLEKFSSEYKSYQRSEIEENKFPYSKKEYLWRQAMRWVRDNCHNSSQNFSMIKLEKYV